MEEGSKEVQHARMYAPRPRAILFEMAGFSLWGQGKEEEEEEEESSSLSNMMQCLKGSFSLALARLARAGEIKSRGATKKTESLLASLAHK